MPSLPHRFIADTHEYVSLDGLEIFPNITGICWAAGLVDDRFMTEESRWRGSVVHTLTAHYDMGAIAQPESVDDGYKNFFLAYVEAMRQIPHRWVNIEITRVCPRFHFAGTLDRDGQLLGHDGVLEVKSSSGRPSKRTREAHAIQTALQAVLRHGCGHPVPPQYQKRYALYLFPTGKFALEPYDNAADIDEAYRLLRQFARAA